MITYSGYRLEPKNYASENIVMVDDGTCKKPLNWGLEWINHSPTGLNWGYGGSGCAQLAFAILFHYYKHNGMSAEKAFKKVERGLYQNFKWTFVSKWKDSWTITDQEITNWLRENSITDLEN